MCGCSVYFWHARLNYVLRKRVSMSYLKRADALLCAQCAMQMLYAATKIQTTQESTLAKGPRVDLTQKVWNLIIKDGPTQEAGRP